MEQQNIYNFDDQLDNLYWSLYHVDRQIEQLKKEQLTDLGKRLQGIELDGTFDLLLQQARLQNEAQLAALQTIRGKLLAQQSVIIRQYLPPRELVTLLSILASHHPQTTGFAGSQVSSQPAELLLRVYHTRPEFQYLNEAVLNRLFQVFRVPLAGSYASVVSPHGPSADHISLSVQAIIQHYFESDAHQKLKELGANANWFIQLARSALHTQLSELRIRAQGKQDEFCAVTLDNVNRAAMRLLFRVGSWNDFAQPLQDWPEPLKLAAILSGVLLLEAGDGGCSPVINPIFALQLAARISEQSAATGSET